MKNNYNLEKLYLLEFNTKLYLKYKIKTNNLHKNICLI